MVYHCKYSQIVTFHSVPKSKKQSQKSEKWLSYFGLFNTFPWSIYIANVKTDNSCEIISIFFSTVKTHYANIQNLHTICHCKGCFFEYLKNITNLDKKPNRLVSHILLPLRWNIGCWLWSKINLHIYIFLILNWWRHNLHF